MTTDERAFREYEDLEAMRKDADKEETGSGFGAKAKAAWKKFWDWIGGIFAKIGQALANFFKKIQIFIAGDLKKTVEWLIG